MSVADYRGRRYDVMAFRGVQLRGDAKLSPALAGPDFGEICVGIQKLSQRFLIEFLTIAGSIPYDPERGTRFMREFYRGNFRSEVNIQTIFAFSELEAGINLRREETEDMPRDERYDYASLLNIAILPELVQLSIGVVSLAGTSRKVILPLGHTV